MLSAFQLASLRGAQCAGIDASSRLVAVARDRTAGVRTALQAHGLQLQSSHIQFAPIDLAAGTHAMEQILALPDRPTAVVATNDVLAVGALMACRAADVAVPADISISGVDNTDLGATQTPGLSSIRTPIRISRRAR